MAAFSLFISSLVLQHHQVHLLNVFRMSALRDFSAFTWRNFVKRFKCMLILLCSVQSRIQMRDTQQAGWGIKKLVYITCCSHSINRQETKPDSTVWEAKNKILKMQTSVAEETKHEAWGEWSRKTMPQWSVSHYVGCAQLVQQIRSTMKTTDRSWW